MPTSLPPAPQLHAHLPPPLPPQPRPTPLSCTPPPVTRPQSITRDASGAVTSIAAALHLEGDVKKTKWKLTWLAQVGPDCSWGNVIRGRRARAPPCCEAHTARVRACAWQLWQRSVRTEEGSTRCLLPLLPLHPPLDATSCCASLPKMHQRALCLCAQASTGTPALPPLCRALSSWTCSCWTLTTW